MFFLLDSSLAPLATGLFAHCVWPDCLDVVSAQKETPEVGHRGRSGWKRNADQAAIACVMPQGFLHRVKGDLGVEITALISTILSQDRTLSAGTRRLSDIPRQTL